MNEQKIREEVEKRFLTKMPIVVEMECEDFIISKLKEVEKETTDRVVGELLENGVKDKDWVVFGSAGDFNQANKEWRDLITKLKQ